jgi:hypothetical protein
MAAAALLSSGCAAPRDNGWRVLASAIASAPGRPDLPVFLNWLSRDDAEQYCGYVSGSNAQNLDAAFGVMRNSTPAMSVFTNSRDSSPDVPSGSFKPLDEFRYNPLAVGRLCQPTLPGLLPLINPGAIASFQKSTAPKPVMISPPFPEGSMTAHSKWIIVQHPDHQQDPSAGTAYTLIDRPDRAHPVRNVPIVITIPPAIKGQGCAAAPGIKVPSSHGQTVPPPAKVAITNFYYRQLCSQQEVNAANGAHPSSAAQLGDFAVLAAFHLGSKEDNKWLWVTAWWSLTPDDEFGQYRPQNLGGAGANPSAWRHFVMDATDTYVPIIFNPLIQGSAEYTSNCMACHQRAHFPDFDQTFDRTLLPDSDFLKQRETLTDFVFFPVVLEQGPSVGH